MSAAQKPMLSIIVIVYDMPCQAMNTLFSLALPYQKNVTEQDYEVIVVENRSAHCLDAAAVAALGSQFRYFYATKRVCHLFQPLILHLANVEANRLV